MARMLLEVFPSGPFDTNALLLGCKTSKKAAIIDTPLGCADTMKNRIDELSLQVEMVLFTHSHWDHIADAAKIKRLFDAPLYIHEKDKENLMHPGSDGLPLFFSIEGVRPDGYLTDGQEIVLGELTMRVLHTPGHTPGGICLYLAEQGVLLSGDTLFAGTCGNISFPTAEPEKMWQSLKKLASLPGKTKVYPGHGPTTTIAEEPWIGDNP